MTLLNTADNVKWGVLQVDRIYLNTVIVWPPAAPGEGCAYFYDRFDRADGALGDNWTAFGCLPDSNSGVDDWGVDVAHEFAITSNTLLGYSDPGLLASPSEANCARLVTEFPGETQVVEVRFELPFHMVLGDDLSYDWLNFFMMWEDTTCTGYIGTVLQTDNGDPDQGGFRVRLLHLTNGEVDNSSFDYFYEFVDSDHSVKLRFEVDRVGAYRLYHDHTLVDSYDFADDYSPDPLPWEGLDGDVIGLTARRLNDLDGFLPIIYDFFAGGNVADCYTLLFEDDFERADGDPGADYETPWGSGLDGNTAWPFEIDTGALTSVANDEFPPYVEADQVSYARLLVPMGLGNQAVEVTVSNLDNDYGFSSLELFCHMNDTDMACRSGSFFTTTPGVYDYVSHGVWDYDASGSSGADGTWWGNDILANDTMTWRFESDTDGNWRMYVDGELYEAGYMPDPPVGEYVGFSMTWFSGFGPTYETSPRIESFKAEGND